MGDFIGFYWTLPVPWAGHQGLSPDVEEAAKQSRTIRYQRERARQWVKAQKSRLINERVFMELAPDRGTEHIVPEINKALNDCGKNGAALLIVDMSSSYGWRSHRYLEDVLSKNAALCQLLDPVKILMDGRIFDPVSHFRTWRDVQFAFSAGKEERLAMVGRAVEALASNHPDLAGLAAELNSAGYTTATGKPWNKENLRKFLRNL